MPLPPQPITESLAENLGRACACTSSNILNLKLVSHYVEGIGECLGISHTFFKPPEFTHLLLVHVEFTKEVKELLETNPEFMGSEYVDGRTIVYWKKWSLPANPTASQS